LSQSCFYHNESISFTVLDIENVKAQYGQPGDTAARSAVKSFSLDSIPAIVQTDVLICGGGMGGIAAAIEASSRCSVYLTEETSWLGGQMTSQAVSALDENKYVESSGAPLSYLNFREQIRQAYRDCGDLIPEAFADKLLHPGRSWVTRLSFEPKLAVALIDELLRPLQKEAGPGHLQISKRSRAVACRKEAGQIKAVLLVNLDSGHFTEVQSKVVVDATETGDLLQLAKIAYHIGSDSKALTNEDHAPEQGDPENVQDYTYPFVLEYWPGQNHTIDKPAEYDQFAAAGKFSFYGYHMFEETDDESTGKPRHLLPFWTYRRLIDKELFNSGIYQSDISMINWDSNDLRGKNFIDKTPPVQEQYLALAKRLSLGFLYWLQTEAPRDNGAGALGYPELKLNLDTLGTADGLAMHPYIREGRRLKAEYTVVEQDIVEAHNQGARARLFSDTVGIGLYPVDIHGHQEVPGAAQNTKPFQIPLRTLVSRECSNYIAACKNIGVSHITNGAYRLHPVEWAIGSAAGVLAEISLSENKTPVATALSARGTLQVQMRLLAGGAPIFWFKDVPCHHPNFQAIQLMATSGIIPQDKHSLLFEPDRPVSKEEIEEATARFAKFCKQFSAANLSLKAGSQLDRSELAETLFKAFKLFWLQTKAAGIA
jgi:hypothetical protein